jgi:O-acetylhomoserine/O-acetylserine sulfhydrylase-like pyridoxal-dependent enzyme
MNDICFCDWEGLMRVIESETEYKNKKIVFKTRLIFRKTIHSPSEIIIDVGQQVIHIIKDNKMITIKMDNLIYVEKVKDEESDDNDEGDK